MKFGTRAFKPAHFDRLESREVLSTGHFGFLHEMVVMRHAVVVAPVVHPPVVTPTVTPSPKVGGGGITMRNVSQDLNAVYQAFQGNGGNITPISSEFPRLRFQGNSVGVDIRGQGDFNTFVGELKSLGVTISSSSSAYNLVEGYVPITALPTLAGLPQTVSVSANYKPALMGHPRL